MDNKLLLIIGMAVMLLIAGCVDKSSAIIKCQEKGYQFYEVTKFSCDTVCMDMETGEKHTFEGTCRVEYKSN